MKSFLSALHRGQQAREIITTEVSPHSVTKKIISFNFYRFTIVLRDILILILFYNYYNLNPGI